MDLFLAHHICFVSSEEELLDWKAKHELEYSEWERERQLVTAHAQTALRKRRKNAGRKF